MNLHVPVLILKKGRSQQLLFSKWSIMCLMLLTLSHTQSHAEALPWLKEVAQPLCKTLSIEHIVASAQGKRLVLLGESTHGTHEYYAWRDQISRALIKSGQARFIAVEGDWAPLWPVNLYVKGKPGAADSAREILEGLSRWPTWMWANEETLALVEWLREWNSQLAPEDRVGFYGMDVYAPWDAGDSLLRFYENHKPDRLKSVEEKLRPFMRHRESPQSLIRAESWHPSPLLRSLNRLEYQLESLLEASETPDFEVFKAKQSVRVIRGAHRHFMAMASGNESSWNARVEHMKATVTRLLDQYGDSSQGIVWAHNTHIGDARATSMRLQGDFNIGQLARMRWGRENVFTVGFSTHRGTVQAGREWEAQRELMKIPPGAEGSLEEALYAHFPEGAMLDLLATPPEAANETVYHRAIGVVFQPEYENRNYVQTVLPMRYDALLFIPETRALQPLHP